MDLTTLKTADGKPIDTSKMDATTLALVGALATGLSSQIKESVEPLTAKLTENEKTIAELAKKPPADPANPNPKPGDKPGDKKDDVTPPNPELEALKKELAELKGSWTGQQQAQQVSQQAEAYLAKNHPKINPNARKLLLDSIVSKAPKDEAGIKAVIDAERERAIAYGADKAKPFGADVEAEGGAPAQDADQEAAKKQAMLDELKNDAKQKQA